MSMNCPAALVRQLPRGRIYGDVAPYTALLSCAHFLERSNIIETRPPARFVLGFCSQVPREHRGIYEPCEDIDSRMHADLRSEIDNLIAEGCRKLPSRIHVSDEPISL